MVVKCVSTSPLLIQLWEIWFSTCSNFWASLVPIESQMFGDFNGIFIYRYPWYLHISCYGLFFTCSNMAQFSITVVRKVRSAVVEGGVWHLKRMVVAPTPPCECDPLRKSGSRCCLSPLRVLLSTPLAYLRGGGSMLVSHRPWGQHFGLRFEGS